MKQIQQRLSMSEEQTVVIQRFFDEYWQHILEIDADGYRRALDAGLREAEAEFSSDPQAVAARMQNMPQDEASFDAEEQRRAVRLHELRVAFTPLMRTAQQAGDAALAAWIDQLRQVGVLGDDQAVSVTRFVRRANFDNGGSWSSADFQKAPDFIGLLEEASKPGQELESIRGDDGFEHALEAIILEYETRVELWVAHEINDSRQPVRASDGPRVVSSETDAKAFDALQKEACSRWKLRFNASQDAVDSVARLLSDASEVERWRNRFLGAAAPQMMKDRLPDKLAAWLGQRDDAAADQVAAAEALEIDWRASRQALRERISRAAIAAKAVVQYLNIAPRDDAAIRAYATDLLSLHSAAQDVVETFRSSLTPIQRADFDAQFPRVQFQPHNGLLSPPMDPSLMRHVSDRH